MGTVAPASLEVLSSTHAASLLMDPTRQRLLQSLVNEADSAVGLARRLGLPRQRVNYHLRAMEEAGLVELAHTRRRRNCVERIVRATARTFLIDPGALGELGAGAPGAQTDDRYSAACLLSLAARTIRETAALMRRSARAKKALATLSIDTTVRFASPADQSAFAEELAASVAKLVARYHNDRAAAGCSFRVLTFVHQQITKEEADDE